MTMTACRECGNDVSTEADDCPHCGCENPVKSRSHARKIWIAVLVLGGLAAIVNLTSGPPALPECDVQNIRVSSETYVVAGSFDAGYSVLANITNRGTEAAEFRVGATLSTSEGKFERVQDIVIQPGSIHNVEYGFHEPSIGAGNITPHVTCKAITLVD